MHHSIRNAVLNTMVVLLLRYLNYVRSYWQNKCCTPPYTVDDFFPFDPSKHPKCWPMGTKFAQSREFGGPTNPPNFVFLGASRANRQGGRINSPGRPRYEKGPDQARDNAFTFIYTRCMHRSKIMKNRSSACYETENTKCFFF